MSTESKEKKFTIIVIKGDRKLRSFEISKISLMILAVSITSIVFLSFVLFFFSFRVEQIFKNDTTAKIDHTAKLSTDGPYATNNSTKSTFLPQNHSLAIENFQAGFSPQKNILNYTFLLKNKNPESTITSGYIFVTLKSEQLPPSQWLTYPKTTLLEGIPQYHKEGDPFSISKYKIIRKQIPAQRTYDSATVFVFSSNGNLLLRENFDLKH